MATDTWKQFERNPISHSAAHHLIAIAELVETVGYARVSDVARRLNITRGSASLTLKTLKQRGLVLEDDNRFIRLSEDGEAVSGAVRGKKFLFDQFFHSILGVDPDTADEDTCKIEHLISNPTADRLARFMRFLTSDDPRAQTFIDAWRHYSEPCDHHPADCPACDSECLVTICETAPGQHAGVEPPHDQD
ncbi:MAG: metal-dependent transcriptional regulator [Phycisphaerae bacterium]